jgi:hypothetical protein
MGALRGANSILYDRGIMWPSSFSGADVEFPPQHGPKDTCPLQASHRKVWGFGVSRGFLKEGVLGVARCWVALVREGWLISTKGVA